MNRNASELASVVFGIRSIADEVLEHVPRESLLGLRAVSRDLNASANRQLFKHAVATLEVDNEGKPSIVVTSLVAGPSVHLEMSFQREDRPPNDDQRYLETIRVLDIRNAETRVLKAIARHRKFFPRLEVVRVFPSLERYVTPRRHVIKPNLDPDNLQSLPYKRSPIIGRKVVYFPSPKLTVPCLLRIVEAEEVIINIDLNETEQAMGDYMPRCPLAIGLSPRLVVIFSRRHPAAKRFTPAFAHQIIGRLAWHLRTHTHADTVLGADFPIKREAMPRFTIAGLEFLAEATAHLAPFYELRSYLVNEFSSRFSCVGCPRPATCPGANAIPPSEADEHVLDFETYDDYMASIPEESRELERVADTRPTKRGRR